MNSVFSSPTPAGAAGFGRAMAATQGTSVMTMTNFETVVEATVAWQKLLKTIDEAKAMGANNDVIIALQQIADYQLDKANDAGRQINAGRGNAIYKIYGTI
jgi:hypothetical protein